MCIRDSILNLAGTGVGILLNGGSHRPCQRHPLTFDEKGTWQKLEQPLNSAAVFQPDKVTVVRPFAADNCADEVIAKNLRNNVTCRGHLREGARLVTGMACENIA